MTRIEEAIVFHGLPALPRVSVRTICTDPGEEEVSQMGVGEAMHLHHDLVRNFQTTRRPVGTGQNIAQCNACDGHRSA